MDRQEEKEIFKRDISIVDVAESKYNFKVDYRKCNARNLAEEKNIALTNGSDTIVVSRAEGTWKFWYLSPGSGHGDTRLGGNVLDFVQWQEGGRHVCNLGKARKILREYTGADHPAPVRTQEPKRTNNGEKNFPRVQRFIETRKHAHRSVYLEGRGISQETLNHPLFKNRVLEGFNGAIVFPHYAQHGACGYEIRGENLRMFTGQGVKGLWYSQVPKTLEKIVFTESPIEALSHFELYKPVNTAYFSPGGHWGDRAEELIKRVIQKYPEARVIAAFNHDDGGLAQSDRLEKHAQEVGRAVARELPPVHGQDWNNILKAAQLQTQDDLKKNYSRSLSR